MNILWDLLDWPKRCGPDSPAMAVSYWRGQEFSNCSVHKADVLAIPI